MALFQDTMDLNRIVEPGELQGKQFVCKVYWRDSKGSLDFGGVVKIAASLFDQSNARNVFIGFKEYHRD